MLSQLEYVQAQAMQLTIAERNQLQERLIINLDADPEVEAAWVAARCHHVQTPAGGD